MAAELQKLQHALDEAYTQLSELETTVEAQSRELRRLRAIRGDDWEQNTDTMVPSQSMKDNDIRATSQFAQRIREPHASSDRLNFRPFTSCKPAKRQRRVSEVSPWIEISNTPNLEGPEERRTRSLECSALVRCAAQSTRPDIMLS